MTRQEALHELYTIFGYGFYNERVDEALNMAIEALKQLSLPKIIIRQGEQEPCDKRTDKRTETHACDCISRQDAIEALDQDVMGGLNYRRILRLLPSADRPTGHWIDTQVDSVGLAHHCICSICGEEPAAWSSVNKFDFCPNCGADMRERSE